MLKINKTFRIKFSNFLGSHRGKSIFNLAYGLGASIAILGTLFKLLHLNGANVMLSVGLGTEVLIFALSSLEPPFRNYKWERVFPDLKIDSDNKKQPDEQGQTVNTSSMNAPTGQVHNDFAIPSALPISDQDVQALTESTKRMTENLNRFGNSMGLLADVSDILLNSYYNITEHSDEISANSKGYVQQMGNLNRNLSGLNIIYEIQLKSISSQIDTVDRINKGMLNIRDMYENSIGDSERFSKETEAIGANLAQLNAVYSRMIDAMAPDTIIANMMNNDITATNTAEEPVSKNTINNKDF